MSDHSGGRQRNTLPLKAPLIQWAMVESEKPLLVITRHHCTYDGRSLPVIMMQVEEVYKADAGVNIIPKASVGCNDSIRYVVSGKEQNHVAYWRNYLSGAIPAKFPRPKDANQLSEPSVSIGHLVEIQMSRSAITLSNVIRGAWGFLVAQYTSSSDVVFGTILSGRNAPIPGIENICGPTFTTVPVRLKVEEKARTVSEYLQRIQIDAIEMIPHEHYGLQNIKRINPEMRRICEFENLLVIHPTSDLHLDNTIFAAQRVQDSSTFRTYAFTMVCQLLPNGMILTANFDPSLIDEMQVRRLLFQFENLIQAMAQSDGSLKLSELDMITKADYDDIWNWNAVVPTAVESCVHEAIRRQMRFKPFNSAIESWDGALTYDELDRLSSRLADHLLGLGIQADVKVPILFEKSMWTVVAIVGILRAGGAFVPLDPRHPKDRLKAMINRVKAELVLTSLSHKASGAEVARNVLVVSSDSIHLFAETGASESVKIAPDFTSGSTGSPKAGLIEHSAYCTGAAGHIPKIAINESSRVFQFASYGFDTCIEDILITLILGGCICIPSEIQRENDTVGIINRLGANWAHFTPSFARSIPPDSVPGLKVLLLGGEAMTVQDVQLWSQRVKLINVYGPCELCVTCSVNGEVTTSKKAANIGFPVGGVSWVAQPHNHDKLAPIGTVGELLVEGPLMARGYMDDHQATGAAFIDAPKWLREGSRSVPGRHNRLYKTGDLVRYDSDGSLFFVGRKDFQVKLRGQRIELGEIEQNIRTCLAQESIDVVVKMVTPEGDTDVSALVAFLCIHNRNASHASLMDEHHGSEYSTILGKLQAQLPRVLPLHMIPSVYIPLNHIPLTVSKKIDHKKLLSLVKTLPSAALSKYGSTPGHSRMPETKLERQIQTIWGQVLNKPIESIKLNTPLFLVGGDSISAMQILARCRRANIDFTFRDLLLHPTIETISACVMERGRSSSPGNGEMRIVQTNGYNACSDPSVAVAANAIGLGQSHCSDANGVNAEEVYPKVHESFPLSSIQRRFFDFYPEGNNMYQLSHLLELQRPLAAADVASSIHSIVQSHSMLRALFRKNRKNRWEQSITDEVTGSYRLRSYERTDLTSLESFIIELKKLIKVEEGPCLIASLINTPQKRVFFLSAHHLIMDLVSWRIILQDLEELLQAPGQPLPPPSTSAPIMVPLAATARSQ